MDALLLLLLLLLSLLLLLLLLMANTKLLLSSCNKPIPDLKTWHTLFSSQDRRRQDFKRNQDGDSH